ncbi:E3 SUMO-protein ligase [Biomphalaria glabrata]
MEFCFLTALPSFLWVSRRLCKKELSFSCMEQLGSGVKTLLKEKSPSVLALHCANHRLELSVAEVVQLVSGINRF